MKALVVTGLFLTSAMGVAQEGGGQVSMTANPVDAAGDLIVTVENIAAGTGTLRIALYRYREGSDWQQPLHYAEVSGLVPGQAAQHIFMSLAFGRYAIKLFHDQNGNKVIDLDESGLPLEPFAFSQAPGGNARVASLQDAVIPFTQNGQELVLKLVQIKNNP